MGSLKTRLHAPGTALESSNSLGAGLVRRVSCRSRSEVKTERPERSEDERS